MLKILEEKEVAKAEGQRELESFKHKDPRLLEREGRSISQQNLTVLSARSLNLYKEASIRLVDNISNLQTYFVREMGINKADLEMQLGITEEILDDTA